MIDTRSDFDHDRQEFLIGSHRLDVERSLPPPADRPASTSSAVRRISNSRGLQVAGPADDALLRKSTARFSEASSLRPPPSSLGSSALAAQPQPGRGSQEEPAPQPRMSGLRRIHYFYMRLFHEAQAAQPQGRAAQQQQLRGVLRPVPRRPSTQPGFQPVSKDPCDTRRLRFTQALIEEKEKLRKKTSMPARPAPAAQQPGRLELPPPPQPKTVAVPQKQKYSFSLEEYLERDRPADARQPAAPKPPARLRDPILSFGEGRSKQSSPASSAEEAPARKPGQPRPPAAVQRQPSRDLQIAIPSKDEIVESEESDGAAWLPRDASNTAVRLLKPHHMEDAKTPASSPIKPKEKKRLDFVPKNSSALADPPPPSEPLAAAQPEAREPPAPLAGDAADKPKAQPRPAPPEATPAPQPKQEARADQQTPAFPSLFSNARQQAVVGVSPPQPAPEAKRAGEQPTKMLITGQAQPSSLFLGSKPQAPDTGKASDVDAKREVPAAPSGPSADPKPVPPPAQPTQQAQLGIDFFTSKPFEQPNAPGFFGAAKPPAQPAPPASNPLAAMQPPAPAPQAAPPQPGDKGGPAVPVPAPPASQLVAGPKPEAGGSQPAQPKPSPFFSQLPAPAQAGEQPAATAKTQEQKKEAQPAENPFISLTRGSTSAGSSFNNLLKENKLSSLFGASQPQQPSSFFAAGKPEEPRAGRSSMIDEERIDASQRPAGRTFFGSEASNQGSSFFAGAHRQASQPAGHFPSTSHTSFAGQQENAGSSSFFGKQPADSRDASNPYFRDSAAAGRSGFQPAGSSGSFFGAGFGGAGGREAERGSGGFGGGNGSLFGTSGPNPFAPGVSQRQSLFGQDDRRGGGAAYIKIKRPSGPDAKNRSLY
jgi:hypothetical protein